MIFAVTGGRDFTDAEVIGSWLARVALKHGTGPEVEMLEGGARGADNTAANIAKAYEWTVSEYQAHWVYYGRRAGHVRNGWMLDRKPLFVLAFPGGRGTANMIEQAEARGISVVGPHWAANEEKTKRLLP